MPFLDIKPEEINSDGKYTTSEVLSWYQNQVKRGAFDADNCIPSVNGLENVEGWHILNQTRQLMKSMKGEEELPPAIFIVAHNAQEDVAIIALDDEPHDIDFVRIYETGKIRFWFEQSKEMSSVYKRKCCSMLEGKAVNHDGEVITIFLPLKKGDEKTLNKLKHAERVILKGMLVNAPSGKRYIQEKHMIVQSFALSEETYETANKVLIKLKDFELIAPLRDFGSGKPVFTRTENACILANAFFEKESVPALNSIIFGPSMCGKSTALKFLVQGIMKGSVQSGTASTGKLWLVSHKEGESGSKLFEEQNSILIDEMFKAVLLQSAQEHQGLTLSLKNFIGKHMEILEHIEIGASSGSKRQTLKGRMKCSFFGSENIDEILISNLGKAFFLHDAPFRRMNFLFIEGMDYDDTGISLSTIEVWDMMKKFYYKNGLDLNSIKNLLMLSRKVCREYKFNVKKKGEFIQGVRKILETRVKSSIHIPKYPDWYSKSEYVDDQDMKKAMNNFVGTLLKFQSTTTGVCWETAAIIRGWEVYKSIETFEPVFDDKQKELAIDMAEAYFQGRLNLLGRGYLAKAESLLSSSMGVVRTSFGGS